VKKPGEEAVAAEEELGDCLYVLLVLANSLGVDAGISLDNALAKVRRRSLREAENAAAGAGSEGSAGSEARQD
jgi:NTP pyrophosphatase (non-canonical NTP hydrolase)